jgi:hypothetical protein
VPFYTSRFAVIIAVPKHMSKKKNDKKIMSLEPAFQEVLVCRNPKDRPYSEIFTARPENISQENLGNISGVFEITDASEDSSYIVNYLISIIKKEYFSRPKRGAVESFEAALHKANLALSKLASHGNVGWIGRLNAVCAVIERNNLHISYTGTASALLLRSGLLTNISEGGEAMNEPNPLKTFQDVLSGRMEDGDKLIIATDSIFEIFSMEEIKRSALKFSRPEFIQFLNTALINELDRASVLVIDMAEKEEEEIILSRRSSRINAFSQSAFQKDISGEALEKKQEEKREIIEELKEEYQKTRDGFVDEKTGHIYIKDGDTSFESRTSRIKYFSASGKKIAGAGNNFRAFFKRNSKLLFSKLFTKKPPGLELGKAEQIDASGETIPKKALSFKEKFGLAMQKTAYAIKVIFYKILKPLWQLLKNLFSIIVEKYKNYKAKRSAPAPPPGYPEIQSQYQPQSHQDFWEKRTSYLGKNEKEKIFSFPKSILPSFEKIRNIANNLSYHQKIYAILAVAVLIILPYFIAKYLNKAEEAAAPVSETITPPAAVPLEQDKNVARIENLNSAYQGESVISTISINGKNFAVKSGEIISIDDNKNYPLPDNFQNPDFVSQMDDLNFIFIIKNKQITSFSTTARKFQDNNISFPDNASLISARSYLTYLYVLDSKNNQIYRYPRAEGGFGEKTNWLKSSYDLTNAKDMAINENIYVLNGTNILKFFRGKQQDYSIEETATNIIPDKLYTKPTGENLYVLDKTNSRIVKLDKDGNIISQYYNSEIASAKNFAVDEENNIVYVSSENSVKSFGIE